MMEQFEAFSRCCYAKAPSQMFHRMLNTSVNFDKKEQVLWQVFSFLSFILLFLVFNFKDVSVTAGVVAPELFCSVMNETDRGNLNVFQQIY